MTEEDFAHLKDGCTLASASSKLVEIDVTALKEAREDKDAPLDLIDDGTHPPSVTYPFADGRKVNLLARGFPVNFDGAQENIAPDHIQLTRALMVIGVLQATQAKVSGVKRLDVELQKAVLERFKETHYETASDDLKAAIDEGMAALSSGTSRRS